MKKLTELAGRIGGKIAGLRRAAAGRGYAGRGARDGVIADRLDAVERRLARMEEHSHGGRATYVGNNRVLMKAVVADATIAYLLEANDRLLTPWFVVSGRYEVPLTNFFLKHLKPDSHCLDLGSNFGYFTCLFGRFAPMGKVLGVEADAAVAELAQDNVYANGFSSAVRVVNCAVSNRSGELTLFRRNTRSGNTSVVDIGAASAGHLGEAPPQEFKVRAATVDELVDQLGGRVDLIKIDVEGAEPLVFQGMARTLAGNPKVRIVCEWSPAQMAAAGFPVGDFVAELQGLGFECHDIMESGDIRKLSFPELAASPYRTGVLFTLHR